MSEWAYRYAKLAYFYGWTHDYIDGLNVEVSEEYWQAITMIEAQEMLKQMTVANAPYMKPQQYKNLHKSLHKQAYPKTHSGEAPIGPQDLAKLLGARRADGKS